MDKTRVCYDPVQRTLRETGIDSDGLFTYDDRPTSNPDYDRWPVVSYEILKDVEFLGLQGYREHCKATGLLGFVQGIKTTEIRGLKGFVPVKWDGTQFVSNGGNPITKAKKVILVGNQILAKG